MSNKIVTGDDGTKYEVKDDGTLKEATSSSGGIIGLIVDTIEHAVETGVDIVLPDTKK